MSSLNGDTDVFAERRFKEASPMCPSRTIPGKRRHRKIVAFARGSGTSAAVKALKERAPDSVNVIGVEHAPTELLVVEIERNIVLAELPEAMACIREFRALPREKQELLITAAADDDVINSYPELAHDTARPARLLACGLTLAIITRSRSQEYHLNGRQFAKGFSNATESLRMDHRLSASVEARVEEAIARDGFAAVVAKLATAKTQATSYVPKEFVEEFQMAIDEATSELDHRSATCAAIK